jgi:hypothetical protein
MCHNGHQVVDELRRSRFSELPIHSTRHPSVCATFGDLKGKLKDPRLQGAEEILAAVQELWDNITFEQFQMVDESWRDRLRWIIEHEREYVRKRHICNSAISWAKKNRGTFTLLFDHPVSGHKLMIPTVSQRLTQSPFAFLPCPCKHNAVNLF